MSDLPLFPVYLGGVWPASTWFVQHVLELKRHPERDLVKDVEETARDAFLVALDDQLRVGADIVSTSLAVPGMAEGTAILERINGLDRLPTRRHFASRLHSLEPAFQQTKPLVALRGLGAAADAERMLSLVHIPAVAYLPGPYTLAALIQAAPGRLATATNLTTILRGEIEALADTGIAMVQLDETGFAWAEEEPAVLADLLRRTVDGVRLEVCLRLGYLDGYGRPMGRRCYLPWLVNTANAVASATLNVRQFDLAFGGVEMAEIEVLAQLPPRRIGLGIVDTTCSWTEPPELLVERLRRATQHVPAERIWLAADAGLGALTRAVAIRKVHSMVEAARQMRELYGIRQAPPATSQPAVEATAAEPVREPNGTSSQLAPTEPLAVVSAKSENGEITS
jgi:methionine synthase II (cobalamin-independent)